MPPPARSCRAAREIRSRPDRDEALRRGGGPRTETAMKRLTRADGRPGRGPRPPAGRRVASPALAAPPLVERATYANPVSKSFADTFADPSVIRGKDGWWYAYGTSDPLREGDEPDAGADPDRPLARPGELDLRRRRVQQRATGRAGPRADAGLWAPGHPLRRRAVPALLRGHRHDHCDARSRTTTRSAWRPRRPRPGRGPTRARPVVGPRPGRRRGDAERLPVDLRPERGHRRRPAVPVLRLLLRRRLRQRARRRRPDHGRRRRRRSPSTTSSRARTSVQRGGYWYLFASTANCCAGPDHGLLRAGRAARRRSPGRTSTRRASR